MKISNYHLASIVRAGFGPQSLKIEISTLNGETVLVASDKNWGPHYLLTVTPYDVELDEPGTISSVAQRWQGIINQALREAQRQRQLPYIRQQLPRLVAIMVAIGGLSIGILRLQRWRLQQNHRLHKQRRHQQASPPTTTASSADSFPSSFDQSEPSSVRQHRFFFHSLSLEQKLELNLALRLLFNISHIFIWLGGSALFLKTFPQIREISYWLIRVPLTYLLMIVEMIVLGFFLNFICYFSTKDWISLQKEHHDQNLFRLTIRGKSIFFVLHIFNTYLISRWVE